MDEKQYEQYVKQVTPTTNTVKNTLKAFFVGGVICAAGQGINNWLMYLGLEKDASGTWTVIILILISVLLTGLNVYSHLVKFGGAGALVPVTGFANSVAASAIEYKSEGHIFGIGCKIFTIAGPVLLFGVLTSWVTGLIYYILMQMGVMV